MSTKLEKIFDEIYENTDAATFEHHVPETFDRIYREADAPVYDDVCLCSEAWLFSDSIGQALAIVD